MHSTRCEQTKLFVARRIL